MTSPIILLCEHVLKEERDAKLVIHHLDGDWQVTCGESDHRLDGPTIEPIHIEHVIDRMMFLVEIVPKMPPGTAAELTDGEWVFRTEDD